MEFNYLIYIFLSLIFLFFIFKLLHKSKRIPRNLPPSPPSIPVIGHLHHLKTPIHRTFQKLSAKYGPVISLRFGPHLVVIVSSAAAAEECFTKNDLVLANRPRSLTTKKHVGYNHSIMIASPYGDHWRNLRRIGAIEVFSTSRLNKFAGIRKEEVERLLRKLARNSLDKFSKVEMQSSISELTLNIMMRMAAGRRYFGDDGVAEEEESRKYGELIKEIAAVGGVSNPGDFMPILNKISNRYEKKLMNLGKKMDSFLQGLIDEHRRKKEEGRNSMIDHLLALQESEPDNYEDQIIKGFILVLLLAGTDTLAVTIEWALSHLLNNHEVLKKVRDELDVQIGQERLIEEFDVPKLRYLQGVILETLRLTPAAPMLIPHLTSDDCTICGYDVPRGTILLVNAWAIHRDPDQWEEPTCFKPERYHDKPGCDVQKLLAFGIGRRSCPGSGMAQRVVGLTLGALIQCYEWEKIGEEEVDMNEGRGLTMPKVVPLEAMCNARPIINKLF